VVRIETKSLTVTYNRDRDEELDGNATHEIEMRVKRDLYKLIEMSYLTVPL